jgi:hypothetical protein
MLRGFTARCPHAMWSLVEPNVGNGRSIIIPWTNVAIMCGAKPCHIYIGPECVYQCRGI